MFQLEKLRSVIEKICKNLNVYLFDVEIKGNKNNPLILVFVDTLDGITLGECEKISRLIQDEIDFSDEFPTRYRLDVSSPGLDKPLREDFQFKRNINRELQLKLAGQIKPISGKLKSFDSEKLTLEDYKGNSLDYPRKSVQEAKIKLKW